MGLAGRRRTRKKEPTRNSEVEGKLGQSGPPTFGGESFSIKEVENCVKCYWKSSKNTGFSHVEVTGIYDRITFSGMVKVTAG